MTVRPLGQRRWSRQRTWISASVVLILLGLSVVAAYRVRVAQAGSKLPLTPLRRGEFLVIVRCRGELAARRSVQILAPTNVPDLRIVWTAPPSSLVSKGEVVIRFDPSSAKQQLLEKEAALKQAQATLDQAAADVRITAEQDKRDLASASYDVERARLEASKKDVVSAIQGEESRIDHVLAQQKLRVQEATVGQHDAAGKAKLASLARVRDQAKAEVELTNERLKRMELTAPSSGLIVYLSNYSQGWLNAKPFKVGDPVWPGATVAEIPDLETLEMEGKIEEIDRGRVTAGTDVRIRVDSLPELTFPGKLARISPLTQMSFEWPATSSFRGSGKLDKTDPRLRPGMNASMDIIVKRLPDTTSIPAKALFTRHGRPTVYVARQNRYLPWEVRVLARNPDEVAIEGAPPDAKVTLVEPESKGENK
jgi:HlyD family secretion protein